MSTTTAPAIPPQSYLEPAPGRTVYRLDPVRSVVILEPVPGVYAVGFFRGEEVVMVVDEPAEVDAIMRAIGRLERTARGRGSN